jgi:hypothetical protein
MPSGTVSANGSRWATALHDAAYSRLPNRAIDKPPSREVAPNPPNNAVMQLAQILGRVRELHGRMTCVNRALRGNFSDDPQPPSEPEESVVRLIEMIGTALNECDEECSTMQSVLGA